jgi:hypothetical protein
VIDRFHDLHFSNQIVITGLVPVIHGGGGVELSCSIPLVQPRQFFTPTKHPSLH